VTAGGARRAAAPSKPGVQARRAASALGLAAALLAPGEAAAYIDPGTGSLVIQGLIAGFAATAVVLRGYWYRIKAFFRRGRAPDKPQDPDRQGGPPE
jgi:hypothetical protein